MVNELEKIMEIKAATMAIKTGLAVEYKGKRYRRINAIIKRKYVANGVAALDEDEQYQAELYDGVSNSVVIAKIKDIKNIEED